MIYQPHLRRCSLTVVLRRVLNMEQPNALIWGALDYSHIFMSSDAPCYSVSFDECMNKISQNYQMDFLVRYWDRDTGQDSVRCIGSEFLGHGTAADLLTHFKDGIRELDPKRLLHGWTQWVLTGSSTLFWHENAKHRNSPNFWTSEAGKSWKQFKLSWKSHGIVLSDFCGNPVIYGTNKNDINHSHFENI